MKKVLYILMSFVLISALSGCSDYLDKPSKTQMNDENYWTSETNVRLFVNGGYANYFVGYSSSWSQQYAPGVYSSGEFSDDRTTTNTLSEPLIQVPADNWYRNEGTNWLYRTGAEAWNFGWVRKWNLLIDRLATMKEKGILNDEQFNHWNGVARFLRGFEYSRLVQSFGDVPYYDAVVDSEDEANQYKERDPRTTVMTKVMEDFDYAMENVRTNDGENYVNKYIVATFASRFMLFEGTWYKYHPGSGTNELAKQFLQKAVSYGDFVINSGKFQFDTDFRSLFGSETKIGNETIMFRSYSDALSLRHCIASYSNLDEGQTSSANLSTVKAFICNDGQPYQTSSVANASSWYLEDLAKTRDPRFEATFWDEPTTSATGIYCVKFIDREGPTYAYNGKTRPTKYGSNTNTNGYPVCRLAEVVLNWIEAKQELALSYGGAAVTQSDLDKSINAIRNRPLDAEAIAKGVQKTSPLLLSSIPDDPNRTSAAEANTLAGVVSDKLLWEIRRERRMEFYMEQYRVLDIRRWGKLELMQGAKNPDIMVGGAYIDFNKTQAGFLKKPFDLITKANFKKLTVKKIDGTVVVFDGTADADGNIISSNADQMVGFRVPDNIKDRSAILERNYLEPICTDVIKQYEDRGFTITQNPGW